MKQIKHITTIVVTALAMSLSSCVKDKLYDPAERQPEVTVTPDWSDRGDGVAIPALWHIAIGDYTADETGATHQVGRPLRPDGYILTVYNPAEKISVDATVATVSAVSHRGSGPFIEACPGWLFTHVSAITIREDHDHGLIVPMRQQMRQLTLILEIEGSEAHDIETVSATLSGVAGSLDFATDTYGDISDIELHFTRTSDGSDVGRWQSTVRLLGIAGDTQHFSATATFAGATRGPLGIESDLSASLAGFNMTKTIPLTLSAKLVDIPDEADVTAGLDKWDEVDVGNIDAH